MPNISAVFKGETARVARKEIRSQTQGLPTTVGSYRHQIAEIKCRLVALERQVKAVMKKRSHAPTVEPDPDGSSLRFRPDGLKKHCERLGLSA